MITKKKVMTDGEIYQLINDAIKPEHWRHFDFLEGKIVDIFPEWTDQLHTIVSGYRRNGWNVLWWKNGQQQYLQFECPSQWRRK